MISYLKSKVQGFWNGGHERTLKIKRNIIYTLLIKGAGVLIGFILIPMTIGYVTKGQYGIWLTIASLVMWMNTFDIGLSNGLRNKMAHSLALGERDNIVKYISTTYAILFLISVTIFLAFFLVGSFFDWNQMLNVKDTVSYNIWPIVLIAIGSFCVQFFLQPINSVLMAAHQPFKSSLILLLGQVLTFVIILLLTMFTHGSLFFLVFAVAGSPLVVFLFANIYLYSTEFKLYAPKFSFIDFGSARSLLSTGGVFFFIQMGAVVLYQTDNILITRTLGPDEVTTFNVAYKYFSLISVIFSIIMTPYWSAFTDAAAKNDWGWIKHSLKKMRMIWVYVGVLTTILYLFSSIFYQLWLHGKVDVPNFLSLNMAIFVLTVAWQSIYAYTLNGIGKLRIQLIFVVGTAILNIPLSIVLIHWIGVSGSVIANTVMVLLMNVIFTYQVNLIVKQKAAGVWNK
ncbi:oligosaccharide flippase family protein [Mucilaginibacter sp.]|jgi:O-antigen/teichoic acid export membrane protein|uniref:oligosaccharide flippase family protein n=1 Tax=Mucilaginibacter sp. TaxID=1882438 RepID=UPI002CEDF41F|nr:oligosaccharide flippase family protein [Mucilaginibacter sp.]HTI61591.1 oligosaccharide flippase family protein [Mucilaginibacter sp.]